jgi:hypothetical protein
VRRELDYVRRADQVVTIPRDLPLPDLDLTRPRQVDDAVVEEAGRWGLASPIRSLVASLSS